MPLRAFLAELIMIMKGPLPFKAFREVFDVSCRAQAGVSTGAAVRMRGPLAVTATVCSKWADLVPS